MEKPRFPSRDYVWRGNVMFDGFGKSVVQANFPIMETSQYNYQSFAFDFLNLKKYVYNQKKKRASAKKIVLPFQGSLPIGINISAKHNRHHAQSLVFC